MNNNFQRKAILMFGFVLTFCVSITSHGADILSSSDRLLFAEGLYNRQLYKQAAKEYARYLEDYPDAKDNDALLCKLGESLRLSGDKQGACKVFYVLVKHKNSRYNIEALLKLASMLLDINKVDDAEQISDMLLEKDLPNDILAEALYLHGSALVRSGKSADAIEDFDRLVRECGSSRFVPYAKVALGSLLADPEKNQLQRAEKLLTEAISSNLPTKSLEAESYFYLGVVRYGMKKYREAARDFVAITSKFPEDDRINDVYIKLAWSYFFAGMYTEASTTAVGALQTQGGFTSAQIGELRYIAANSYFEVSNYDKAIELYKSIVQVDQSSVLEQKATLNLARAYYNKGHYAEMIDVLRPILNHGQYREEAVWFTAEAAKQLNKTDIAIQNYRILVDEFPNSEYADDAMYSIGCVYRNAQQREEAASAFLLLSEKYPKSEYASDALFFAAHSYAISNDERALGLWKRFVNEHSGHELVPAATYHIAVEENLRGNVSEALDAFILIYSAYPQSEFAGEAYLWSANLFATKGELVQSEKNLRKALTLKLSVDSEQQAKFMLAITLQKQKKEDESIAIMRDLLDNSVAESFTPQNLAWLSRSLIDRKYWADAEKAAVKLASGTKASSAWKQAGWALAAKAAMGAGKVAEAETYYRNALSCDAKTRDYIECSYLLGELLMKKKNFVEAEACFAEASRLSVDMPEFTELRIYSYIGHGHSAIAQGKRDEGIRLLTAATIIFSHETLLPPVMDEVIKLLIEDGREDEAETVREDLIRMYPNSEQAKRYAAEAK